MNDEPLESTDWRKRKQAIEELSHTSSAELPQKLLRVIKENHRNLGALNAALQLLSRLRSDVIPGLVSLLEDPDPEVRAYALIVLAQQKAPQTIPALIRAVDDPDPNVRFNAIEALGEIRAIEAVEALVKILRQHDFYLGFAAIEALVKIGASSAVDDIASLLTDEVLASSAVEALGKLGNLSTLPLLLKWLDSPLGEVGPVVIALCELHRRVSAEYSNATVVPIEFAENISAAGQEKLLAAFDAAMQKAAAGLTPMILPALVTVSGWLLANPQAGQSEKSRSMFIAQARKYLMQLLSHPNLRGDALEALKQTGKEVIPSLLSKLDDPDPEARRTVLAVLGSIGDRAAVPGLTRALDFEESDLVAVAAGALGKIGDRSAFDALCDKLSHPSALVRQTVVAAINSLGHPQHTERMLELAQDTNPWVRESAIRSLGYFGDPRSLDAVLSACRDEAQAVRQAAIESLAMYEDDRIYDEILAGTQDPHPAIRAAAVRTLRFMPAAFASPLLLKALSDSDMWVRVHACRSLSHFHSPAAEKAVAALAADHMPPVRAAAAETLGFFGGKKSVEVLQGLLNDPESEVISRAIQGLAATHQAKAVPVLFELANHPAENIRLQAISALGMHGGAEAVAALRRLIAAGEYPEQVFAALLQIRSPEAVEIIVQSLQNVEHRRMAVEASCQLGESVLPGVSRILNQPDCAEETRLAIAHVLQNIHSTGATDLLIQLLKDDSAAVRLTAIYALGEIGSQTSLGPLTQLARTDPDPQVQMRARLALQKIA